MKLQIKHKKINPLQHELTIEFGWDEVEKRIPEILNEYKENTDIPEDVFPQGPPNIQSHGPYSVPTDVLNPNASQIML
jgi:hypothetical protein